MILVNGKETNTLSILDRGLSYGDGIFETIAIINKLPHNWPNHYQRMCVSGKRLGIDIQKESLYLNDINILSEKLNVESNLFPVRYIVKIIITRGEGGRGYAYLSDAQTTRICISSDWPNFPSQYYQEGVAATQLDFTLAKQSILAGIKHLNRLEQVIAQSHITTNFQEGILCNDDKVLVGGVSSNLYFVKNNCLYIPKNDISGVEGTIKMFIKRICEENNISFQEGYYHFDELITADEVFFSNSIRGLWPVKSISTVNFGILQFNLGNIHHYLSDKINKSLQYI